MPSGEPTKAPLIILGSMFSISIITVSVVAIGHCNRDQPYLDSKMIRVRYMQRVIDAGPVGIDAAPTPDANSDAGPSATPPNDASNDAALER